MPPAVIAGAMVAGGGIASSVVGANAAKKASNNARAIQQQGIDAFQNLTIPDIQSQLLQLEQLKVQGTLTPEQERVIEQKESELKGILVNPQYLQAQNDALAKLQQIGTEGGLTATDRARMNEITNEQNATNAGQQGAIMQNFAQRGQAGSGLELAARLQAQQGASQQAADRGFQTQADAEQRALAAIQGAGQLGGQIGQQQFGQQAQIAEAQDAINAYNARNSQDVQARNVGVSNQAQQLNLQNAQNVANSNAGIANAQQEANKGLIQQQFGNQLAQAQGVAGQSGQMANQVSQAGKDQASLYGGIGQSLIGAGGTLAGYGLSEKKKKEGEA